MSKKVPDLRTDEEAEAFLDQDLTDYLDLQNFQMVTVRPQRIPTHPGALLRETVLPDLGLSIAAAARHLKVSRVALSNVLHEHTDLSADMAARLEKAFGLDMGHLLRMQLAHTEAIKRQHWDEIDVERFGAS